MASKNGLKCDHIKSSKPSLEQLLARPDIWRGRQKGIDQVEGLDTGFAPLNAILSHGGWPQGSLIDIALDGIACEWLLMQQLVTQCSSQGAYTALINPPYTPYAVGLAKLGIALDRLLVFQPKQKNDFIACFSELSRNSACRCILSWSPKQALSYKELRKCHLATLEQEGAYVIFRQSHCRKQSSPASLRLLANVQGDQLNIQVFKQKGKLIVDTLCLDISEHCLPLSSKPCIHKHISKARQFMSSNSKQTLLGY